MLPMPGRRLVSGLGYRLDLSVSWERDGWTRHAAVSAGGVAKAFVMVGDTSELGAGGRLCSDADMGRGVRRPVTGWYATPGARIEPRRGAKDRTGGWNWLLTLSLPGAGRGEWNRNGRRAGKDLAACQGKAILTLPTDFGSLPAFLRCAGCWGGSSVGRSSGVRGRPDAPCILARPPSAAASCSGRALVLGGLPAGLVLGRLARPPLVSASPV